MCSVVVWLVGVGLASRESVCGAAECVCVCVCVPAVYIGIFHIMVSVVSERMDESVEWRCGIDRQTDTHTHVCVFCVVVSTYWPVGVR